MSVATWEDLVERKERRKPRRVLKHLRLPPPPDPEFIALALLALYLWCLAHR